MKKIELNAVANIQGLLYIHDEELPQEFKDKLKDQLDVLERYMVAIRNYEEVPFWHEVRDNRSKYPKVSK